ncbi:MAG TPA: SUMF1/EgtB/PvdO family nonheme iron enzyme [Polyangiaceae bacterium]|nr:SUMF1/EgtB/PvdO family nonheme iron enzyme [Polyangiaceae bacterium]
MKVNVHIIQLHPPRWLRPLVAYAALPLTALLGSGAAICAVSITLPHVFMDGDLLTAAAVNQNFTVIRDAIQTLAATAASPYSDCPLGYTRTTTAGAVPVVCMKGRDQMVKVGTGSSAFWIDRYESSAWSSPNGSADASAEQYGLDVLWPYPNGFGKSGESSASVYALSESGVLPAGYATWFQANLACRMSGKRLPTGDEWLMAASGTVDPGENDGATGSCVTSWPATATEDLRRSGLGATGCVSTWGAEDMIGNMAEFTAEWGTGVGLDAATMTRVWEGTIFNGDGTWNVACNVVNLNGYNTGAIPAAIVRGGGARYLQRAGSFGLFADRGPSNTATAVGFRCALSR